MRSKAVGFRMRFWPALLCLLASLVPAKVHAQTCTLDPPLPSSIVDSAAGTRFFPSGGDGQILVQRKYTDTTVIRVFETSGPDPASWKDPVERTVISFRPMPEKGYEEFKGFAIDKTSLIRLIVPNIKNSFWQTRTFVVRICDQAARGQAASGQGASGQAAAAQGAAAQGATSQAATGNALAIVQVPISPPIWAKLMTIGFLLCVYVLFALAVYQIRGKRQGKQNPLAVKYPALKEQRSYGWFEHLDPVVLTANAFNKGSIQKLQVLFFSILVSGMVLSLVLTIGALSDLSYTVALLLGISAVGAAVAQKTTSSRDRLSFQNWAWLVRKGILPVNDEDNAGPQWSDLVMTNREFDIYKLQTLIFSIVVGAALLAGGEEHLASFSVPDTLLGILGLSQVAYISGTLAGPQSITDLDNAITELRDLETKVQTVVARDVDLDGEGNLPKSLPKDPSTLPLKQRTDDAVNALTLYKKKADDVEIMLESTFGSNVERTKLDATLS